MRLLLLLLCGCEGGEYSIEILLPNKFPKLHHRIAKTNFHQTLVQGRSIRIWCQGFHPLCGIQIGSLVAPYSGWVASITVIHSSLRLASLEAWTYQSQGKSRHFTIVLLQKTLGFRTNWIGCLAAPRGRSNWKMVSVHFFCFQLFNYRNPIHQIHCSRQGNRKKRRNKWRDVTYHTERDEKRKETDDKR